MSSNQSLFVLSSKDEMRSEIFMVAIKSILFGEANFLVSTLGYLILFFEAVPRQDVCPPKRVPLHRRGLRHQAPSVALAGRRGYLFG